MEYIILLLRGGGVGARGSATRSVGNEEFPPALGGRLECMDGESIEKLVGKDER